MSNIEFDRELVRARGELLVRLSEHDQAFNEAGAALLEGDGDRLRSALELIPLPEPLTFDKVCITVCRELT